ncbi:hypothetical protein L4C42_18305 [Vibrio wakamikoensis]|uniref:Uncharacterized protein n=1 Tax=Vibrio chaetopteri TaxID=3016528 RepID=A0AAU8BP72_9VIBR
MNGSTERLEKRAWPSLESKTKGAKPKVVPHIVVQQVVWESGSALAHWLLSAMSGVGLVL